MYSYTWDSDTGGLLLNSSPLQFSKEPRPVYWRELDLLGFNKYWKYPHDDSAPIMWAEANNYIYRGRPIAKVVGGSMFTAPTIEIIEDLKGEEAILTPVDIKEMVERNKEILDLLSQSTIKFIYNTYLKYKKIVDLFHVSYSGGKDSEVNLDLVARALPHNSFVVVFGDTMMEFPDTYDAVSHTQQWCESNDIKFYIAKGNTSPLKTWNQFGPPTSTIRWCCSVHKTTPQLLLIRDIIGKDNFTEMAFVGVRADESVKRSSYDEISYGTKHRGQYSCNPILEWNSAEVYLYIYRNNLYLNKAYTKGLSRAGCLVCPMASKFSEHMRFRNYDFEVSKFTNIIKNLNASDKTPERLRSYIENSGWKVRKNGRDLSISDRRYEEFIENGHLIIRFNNKNNEWRIWGKTIGPIIDNDADTSKLSFISDGTEHPFTLISLPDGRTEVKIIDQSKTYTDFYKRFRRIFRKSHYCVSCKVCEANCKHGNLKFDSEGNLFISDKCFHCGECLEIGNTGCLVYKSLWLSNNAQSNMKQKSLDCYATHAPQAEWFNQLYKLGDSFDTGHSLGNNMVPIFKRFLRETEILKNKNEKGPLNSLFFKLGVEEEVLWGLMLVNAFHNSPLLNWYVKQFQFGEEYTQKYFSDLLSNEGSVAPRSIKSIPNDVKKLMQLPIGRIGLGVADKGDKTTGFTFIRQPYSYLDPRVLLYALYKYAEACGDFKQFTMSRLYDESIDSDGVSPVRIFGTDEEDMEKMLKGLSIKYPEFINVSFTHDLDTITLKDDKSSEDVLTLF